jgi:hypothetical protein
MRFRPPLKQKWFYPFILCGFVALAYGVITFASQSPKQGRRDPGDWIGVFQLLLFVGVGSWVCIMVSWTVWTDRVDVDDQGIRWKDGTSEGFLKWEEISSLSLEGISVGLVERGSAKSRRLPFVTRKLYAHLAARLKPLTPAEEEILFPSGRSVERK